MVTVEVGEEYVSEAREFKMVTLEGVLGTFTAIHHKKVAAVVNDRGRRLVAERWFCRAASESMDGECGHVV